MKVATVVDCEVQTEDEDSANHISVEVCPTELGQGVFALKKFRRNDVIGEVLGNVIHGPDYSSDYCMDLGHDNSMEPEGPFRFLNHSCEPNTQLFQYVNDEGSYTLRMWVQAIKKIRPGEQLTIDYSWPADSAIACKCGTKKCRGWIVDPTELKLVKKREKKIKKQKRKEKKSK